jgi:hypothetical protein
MNDHNSVKCEKCTGKLLLHAPVFEEVHNLFLVEYAFVHVKRSAVHQCAVSNVDELVLQKQQVKKKHDFFFEYRASASALQLVQLTLGMGSRVRHDEKRCA